jgi:hypothetical protein
LATVFQNARRHSMTRIAKTLTTLIVLVLATVVFTAPASAQTTTGNSVKEQRSTVERLKKLTLTAMKKAGKKITYESNTETWFQGVGFYSQVGCVETRTNVYAADTAWRVHGEKPVRTQTVEVTVDEYDVCNEVQLSWSWGWATPDILSFKGTPPPSRATSRSTTSLTISTAMSLWVSRSCSSMASTRGTTAVKTTTNSSMHRGAVRASPRMP